METKVFDPFTRELDPKRFCKIVFVIAVVCFGFIATLNFVVNPYAQYATSFFEPFVQTSRAQKVELLQVRSEIPGGLILGSSRVMKLEPDYLERKTGVPFFNAGMNHAKPEDFLAYLRFFQSETGRKPRIVVLGIDEYAFSDMNPTDARLLANPLLVRYVSDFIPFPDRMKRWTELVSWQQSVNSVKSVVRRFRGNSDEPPIEEFRPDGLLVYLQRERQLAEGTYDFAAALDFNKHEYTQLLRQYDSISNRRVTIFHKLVDACLEQNVKLYVFMTPMHPQLRDYLADRTHLEVRRKEIATHMKRLSMQRGFEFVDLFEIASFGGDEKLFVDGIHPLEPNTRRMIDKLLSSKVEANQYAVQ